MPSPHDLRHLFGCGLVWGGRCWPEFREYVSPVRSGFPLKITFAHLCDHAMVANGKLSLIGIFTTLGGPSFPLSHGPFFLAFEVEFVAAEVGRETAMEIQLRDADGGQVFKLDAKIKPGGSPKPGERGTSGQIVKLGPIKFEKPGTYEFAFFLSGALQRSLPFQVVKAEARVG